MFEPVKTRLTEEIVIPPSCLGDVEGNVQMQLRQMYIDVSCPQLGIGLNVDLEKVKSILFDPNSGECVASVVFTLRHVIPKLGQIITKKPNESDDFQAFSFEETDEKVAVVFRGDALKYEITLCEFFDKAWEI